MKYFVKLKEDIPFTLGMFLWAGFFLVIGWFGYVMIHGHYQQSKIYSLLNELNKDDSAIKLNSFDIDNPTTPRITYAVWQSKKYDKCYLVKTESESVTDIYKFETKKDLSPEVQQIILNKTDSEICK